MEQPMRRLALFLSALIALTLGLVAVPTASADSTTDVAFDSFVREFNPTQTNGAATTLLSHGNVGFRKYPLVQVTTPALSGETLDAAYLRVHVTGTVPSGATLTADLVGNSWTESGVNWNTQPALVSNGPSSVNAVAGWNSIPIDVTPGTTQSYRVRTQVTVGDVNISSQENADGNGPEVVLETTVTPVQNPSATRGSTDCGVVDVDYATGAGDNTASQFATTVDGVQVDSESVVAPSGAGGHNETLAEDSSGGSADVVVTGNGTQLLSFAVDTDCVTPPPTGVIVGMSAPASSWSQRLSEVGPCGVEARRIFADLTSTGQDQSNLIEAAIDATMLPVVSYKVPSVSTLNSNGYDSWLNNLNSYLGGLGTTVSVTFWHEPHGDMTATEFRNGSQQFLDHLTASNIKVGPLLNGWLLDNQVSTFASYTSTSLINQWDFVGLDSYQAGSQSNPDPVKYGGRGVPLLRAWLDGQGFTDEPIVLGEYNGFTADSLDKGGEQVLKAENKVWAGLVWNSTGGLGVVLSGQRLTEYQQTKADSRALHDPPC